MKRFLFSLLAFSAFAAAADLTGNWVASEPRSDGSQQRTYLNLKQEGSRITGFVRTTQFYYKINDSTGSADDFTLKCGMQDGNQSRTTEIKGKLVGDELHITMQRRRNAPPVELVAHHAPQGEGAMPERIPPPALHHVKSNGLAKTPPMGWNSWNKFAGKVDDAAVRGAADAIASNGMKAAGYVYVNIDDTWQGERDAKGILHPNKKFPDMKALADYVHSKGLKIGIYSSPGPNTCAGYEGSFGHETQDAHTYAEWGIDYLKYDWCGARNLYKDEDMQALYQKMGDALNSCGRKIVYSLCQYGRADVWKWGPEVGGNLWRTTGDIRDAWESMATIGFGQADLAPYAAPGHWNDPDMLEIGNGGMTNTEYKTHMSLWSLLAAPLLAGNDLTNMDPEILQILTNKDVIAIDQDSAGKQATRTAKKEDTQVWVKPLRDGSKAIGLFNLGPNETSVSATWTELQFAKAPKHAQDLWLHKEFPLEASGLSAQVPSHGVTLLRIKE